MAQDSWNCDTAEGSGCQQQQENLVLCPNNCSEKVAAAAAMAASAEKSLISAGKFVGVSGVPNSSSTDPGVAISYLAEDVPPMASAPSLQRSPSPVRQTSPVLPLPDLGPLSALFGVELKEAQPAPRRQSANKCFNCRKRTGLLGFKCRCGYVFCVQHRYSDKHSCTYDYKSAAREAIAKANPIVKAQKVEKI